MSWPHKEDGTIDWDVVFDDPDIGLVPYVERAQSLEALGLCAHIIVHSLFIREQDRVHRDAFNHMIDELIQSTEPADEQRTHDLVLTLVHDIKANRVKHAQNYLDADIDDAVSRRAEHDPTEVLKALEEKG